MGAKGGKERQFQGRWTSNTSTSFFLRRSGHQIALRRPGLGERMPFRGRALQVTGLVAASCPAPGRLKVRLIGLCDVHAIAAILQQHRAAVSGSCSHSARMSPRRHSFIDVFSSGQGASPCSRSSKLGVLSVGHLVSKAHRLPRPAREGPSLPLPAAPPPTASSLRLGTRCPVPGSAHADTFLELVERFGDVDRSRIRAASFSQSPG